MFINSLAFLLLLPCVYNKSSITLTVTVVLCSGSLKMALTLTLNWPLLHSNEIPANVMSDQINTLSGT